jgi:hypothetical protein
MDNRSRLPVVQERSVRNVAQFPQMQPNIAAST